MTTYQLLSGEKIQYPEPNGQVAKFLERVRGASENHAVSIYQMIDLVYGLDNPILDKNLIPGRAMVTQVVFENPLYRVMSDYVGRKRIQLGLVDIEAVKACHTVSVQEAAEKLGITPVAVRQAIKSRRLDGMLINGQWWLRQEGINAYRVSNRGPKRKELQRELSSSSGEDDSAVLVRVGAAGGLSLSVRVNGGEVLKEGSGGWGKLSSGWESALVRLATKAGIRVIEIKPALGQEIETIEHGKMFVRGQFEIVKRHNSTEKANELWKSFATIKVES